MCASSAAALFVVRTAWLYSLTGKNFVFTMMNAGKKFGKLTVVNDQLGNPTNAEDLAHHLLKMVVSKEYGVYHCTGEGVCSWYDFAVEIMRLSGVGAEVAPCTSDEYAAAHPRSGTPSGVERFGKPHARVHRRQRNAPLA